MSEVIEAANHPLHYGGADNPYEAIKIIDAWRCNFNTGSALKYLIRAGKKPGVDATQDLDKAAWYLNHQLDRLHALCMTANSIQPFTAEAGYALEHVLYSLNTPAALEAAMRACCEQCSALRVAQGLAAIKVYKATLNKQ